MSLVWLAAWAGAQHTPDEERQMQDALLGPPGCWVVPFSASEVRDATTQLYSGHLRFADRQWSFVEKPHPLDLPGGVGVAPYTTLFGRWQYPVPVRGSTAVEHALTLSRRDLGGRTVLAAETGTGRGAPVRFDYSVLVHLEHRGDRPVSIEVRDTNSGWSVTRTILLHESGLPSSETIESVEPWAVLRRHRRSTTTYTFESPRRCEDG